MTDTESYATLKHYEGESEHSIVENYLNEIQQPMKKVI